MAGLKVRTLAGAEVLSGVAPCLVRDLKQLIRSKGGPPTCQQQLLLQEVLCDEALATEDLWLVVGPGPNLWRTLVLSCDLAKEAKSSLERRFKVLEQWTQEDLLREVGVEVVRSFLEGFNGCVISYGHTGSGKERIWEEDGLLFRSLDLFFASAGHLEPWTLCLGAFVWCSRPAQVLFDAALRAVRGAGRARGAADGLADQREGRGGGAPHATVGAEPRGFQADLRPRQVQTACEAPQLHGAQPRPALGRLGGQGAALRGVRGAGAGGRPL